jgi:glycosyltransferase involved in cell wall biosynthesis
LVRVPFLKIVFNAFFNAFWSLSGGDRIFVECLKRWVKKGLIINVFTVEKGYNFCVSYGLSGVNYKVLSSSKIDRFGFLFSYIVRMVRLCLKAMVTQFPYSKDEGIVVYSMSDFWPDSIPAWILKMRLPSVKWVAAFFLFAPSPFGQESPYKGWRRLRGLFYYLSQLPVYALIRRYADMVWVTSEPDRWRFIDSRLSPSKVIAVRGGVDVETPASVPEPKEKRFDAVFIGRFHPQKGVLELIDIWNIVVQRKKDARLAIIGVGDLERQVREKIRVYGLEDNVVLFGFKDGVEKLKIFKESKIVVHPAIYDSGGMAACEAMSCGLPGVSFDLPALKTYYPKGMLKTPCYDLEQFAENILKLIRDKELYKKTAKDAVDWSGEWDWDKRANQILNVIKEDCLNNLKGNERE